MSTAPQQGGGLHELHRNASAKGSGAKGSGAEGFGQALPASQGGFAEYELHHIASAKGSGAKGSGQALAASQGGFGAYELHRIASAKDAGAKGSAAKGAGQTLPASQGGFGADELHHIASAKGAGAKGAGAKDAGAKDAGQTLAASKCRFGADDRQALVASQGGFGADELHRIASASVPHEQIYPLFNGERYAMNWAPALLGFLSLCVAFIAAGALFLLFGLIRALYQSEKLKRNRRNEPAIADLLNYAALVEDGVIVCKSGALMAAFLYEGKDDTSSEDVEKEQVSLRINRALLGLGAGWALHVDAVRRPAPGYPAPELSDFPDPVSAAIDEERRRFFESYGTLYEGYYVLTLTWLPPLVAQRRFVEFMFDDEKKPAGSKQQTRALLDSFRREISRIEGELSSVLKLTRLKSKETINEDGKPVVYEDFLSWLNFCITGESHPIILPSYPMWLDALLGARDCWGGVVPRVGRNFIQIVAIDGFPASLHARDAFSFSHGAVPVSLVVAIYLYG